MKNFGIGMVYLSFYGCVAVACFVTESAWPLCAVIFAPSVTSNGNKVE